MSRTVLEPKELALRALARERQPVARLISLLEDQRVSTVPQRDEALAALRENAARQGRVIGVTGTPGSGKSSLLASVSKQLVTDDPDVTVGIVAVDPSSPTTKGALLGDRTRMDLDVDEQRVFFRSQASATALGGLAPSTFAVCQALTLVFDCVLVETVGIGQSEADIRHLADTVYLVLSPLGGDEIQYLKAGIIEIPDAFVINKWDEPSAKRAYHQLRSSLGLARPADGDRIAVHRTSAKTGYGIAELAHAFLTEVREAPPTPVDAKTPHFFDAWVTDEWGRVGHRHLTRELGGAAAFLADRPGFAGAQLAFSESLRRSLTA